MSSATARRRPHHSHSRFSAVEDAEVPEKWVFCVTPDARVVIPTLRTNLRVARSRAQMLWCEARLSATGADLPTALRDCSFVRRAPNEWHVEPSARRPTADRRGPATASACADAVVSWLLSLGAMESASSAGASYG